MSDVRTLNVLFNLSLVTKLDKHRYLKLIDTLQQVKVAHVYELDLFTNYLSNCVT
jgi:hypothetical protein